MSADSSLPHHLQEHAAGAKTWMKRGIALLSATDQAALPEALRCFDEALQLRLQLPVEESAWFRWLLTACWANRGDVLTRLGGGGNLSEAVRSFDEAIFHLERLPLDDNPQYRGRLVLTWMNRSVALRAWAKPEDALASLEAAQKALEAGVKPDRPADMALRATLIANRAGLLLELSPPLMLEAMQNSETVLDLSRPDENAEMLAAEIGLKARHTFCHAVAMLLETSPVDARRADGWITRANDQVEEALHLAARWEAQGGEHFRVLRRELFAYGCRMYLAYQPHFLAEFLLDVLDPERGSPLLAKVDDLYAVALEALELAAEVMRRRGPLDLGLQGTDRLLNVLASLNQASARIKKLPSRPAGG